MLQGDLCVCLPRDVWNITGYIVVTNIEWYWDVSYLYLIEQINNYL